MRKVFMAMVVALVVISFAVPAMALKLETKGYMDVKGILVKNNIRDISLTQKADGTVSFYKQRMILEPTLSVNEWVKIHNKITIMERYWRGGHGGEFDTNYWGIAANRGGNYRAEHNFWWEQMYLSFPLFGGSMTVGRRPGGAWAYPFQDSTSNRDRVQWTGKIPTTNITMAALLEKLREGDTDLPAIGANGAVGAGNGPFLGNANAYTNSASDQEAYALGFIWPITKEFMWRPLFYFINEQDTINTQGGGTQVLDYLFLWSNGFTYKSGPFLLDMELNYWKSPLQLSPTQSVKRDQFAGWLDMSYKTGPYLVALGGFYLQGNDSTTATGKRRTVATTGEDFEPFFLLFSEDVGLCWNSAGVANGSTGGFSGFLSFYLRGSYDISKDMKLSAKLGMLRADKMVFTTPTSKNLGWEFDLAYEFAFMKNIKYIIEGGFLKAGKYWDDTDGVATADISNNVYGIRHMLVIQW